MNRCVVSFCFALCLPFWAQAQDTTRVEAGDASVQVSEDGSVKVKAGGAEINVGESGVEVKSQPVEGTGAASHGAISIDGVERVVHHACDATHARTVHISGSDNRVTLTGVCDAVVVSGTDNVVQVDGAGRIVVSGVDNTISYKQGKDGKKPVVQETGVDNEVVKVPRK